MKILFLASLLVFSFKSYSTDCVTVGHTCLQEIQIEESLKAYLDLEKKLGAELYDLNHVSNFRAYQGKNIQAFLPSKVTEERLNDLRIWANEELGIYPEAQFSSFQMLQTVKKLGSEELKDFLMSLMMDIEAYLQSGSTLTLEQKQALEYALKVQKQVVNKIAIEVLSNAQSATLYRLLDNDNENVQDAQWVVIGGADIYLINRFWHL